MTAPLRSPKLSYVRGTGFATGAAKNNIEFVIENLSKDTINNVSWIKLTWTTDPQTDFKELWVAGVKIYDGTATSTTTYNFLPNLQPQSITGTGVVQEPFRVDINGLVFQVPDAVIGTVGTGGTLKIEMKDFEESGNNTNVDMTGVTFTVEFSDGSKTLFSPLRK